MLSNRLWGRRQFGICLVILIAAAGWVRGADDRGGSRKSSANSRKEQLQQEAQQIFPEVETQLTQILENVNKNRRPADQTIAQAETTLKDNKRYSLAFEDTQKADYFLLQAWVYFYQDNLSDAMKYSLRACKLDSTSQDAWGSQAVFCLLNDKRPRLPRVGKKKSRHSRRRRDNDGLMMPPMGSDIPNLDSERVPKKGTLKFDLKMLAAESLKKHFDRIDYKKGWGEEYGYDPNEHTLCLLFWRSDKEIEDEGENVDDSDETLKAPKPAELVAAPMMMPGMPPEISGNHLLKLDALSVKGQQQYFGRLFRTCRGHEQIKFVQINTDLPETAKEVAAEWHRNPDAEGNPRLVFASEMDIDPKEYADLNEVGPLMLIVNTEGKVTYVGPAATFAPAFILTALTGVELDLEKMVQAEEAARRKSRDPAQGPMPGMYMPPPEPAAEPNAPESNSIAGGKASKPVNQETDFPTQSLEDQVRAEKLLQSAQMHIEESRKLRMKNPKQGIEDARKVLEEFPNTEHAQKARDLLRRVPSRWRTQHNITDEELGY